MSKKKTGREKQIKLIEGLAIHVTWRDHSSTNSWATIRDAVDGAVAPMCETFGRFIGVDLSGCINVAPTASFSDGELVAVGTVYKILPEAIVAIRNLDTGRVVFGKRKMLIPVSISGGGE